jgi:hypothetical protein
MSFNSNTTGVTSGAGTVDKILILCVVFCKSKKDKEYNDKKEKAI